MVKNAGLGKGLDALFSNSSVLKEINEEKAKEEKVEYIKLIDIEPNPSQARKKFSEESINELATSIKNYCVFCSLNPSTIHIIDFLRTKNCCQQPNLCILRNNF